MNRYTVNLSQGLGQPLKTIVVEASSWESAGTKAERNGRVVVGVRRVKCECDHACTCP